ESAFDFYLDKPSNQLLPDQANYSLERTRRVGNYQPNRLGLFDMHGNVREWCADEVPADPKEPKGAARRVARGGCWHDGSGGTKAASPSMLLFSTSVHYEIGLRLARVPSGAPAPEVQAPPVAIAPFTDADVQRIAALRAEQQIEEVRK